MPAARRPPSDRPAPRRSPPRAGVERPPGARSAGARSAGARSAGTRAGGARPAQRSRTSRDARPRERRRSDLAARILVAVPAAILAIVFVDLGGTAWALFMLAIGCACLYELYGLLERWRPVPAVGFAAAVGMVLAARWGSERGVLEVAVATVPVLFLAILARGQTKMATVSIAGTLLGVYWIGFAFAHAVLLRRVPHGNGVMIDLMVGTFLADTAAYLGGRLFGRRALAPSISPHKTFEGLVCGMLIAILTVFVAGLNQAWLTRGDALLLGITVAVLGPLGDLFESLVKRDVGAKDAGNLFGAHGGALDRMDAVIFTVVGGYYVWTAILT